MVVGLYAWGISVVWSLFTLWLTYLDGMFFPSQMRKKFPFHTKGLPAIAHGGLMDDPILFSLVVALIVGGHWHEWSPIQIQITGVIGLVLSIVMHGVYLQTPIPDPITWKVVGLQSAPGWSHLFYMAVGFAVVGLGFVCSTLDRFEATALSVLLMVHVVIGNHLLLGWLNIKHQWVWCPYFLNSNTALITCYAVFVLLASMSLYAAGWQAVLGFAFLSGIILGGWFKFFPKPFEGG